MQLLQTLACWIQDGGHQGVHFINTILMSLLQRTHTVTRGGPPIHFKANGISLLDYGDLASFAWTWRFRALSCLLLTVYCYDQV